MNSPMKKTILCVDDDKKNLELLEALLSPQGYKLKFSASGEDGLAQIAQESPDLILLDIMMPGLSGLEVLKRLRSDERTRSIPVALLTALHDEEDKIKGIEVGCDDFITKPFNMVELIIRVRSLLRISLGSDTLDENERLLRHIYEMSQPLVVCGPDWGIMNLNQTAQRYLMPGRGFESVNFLDFIFKYYSVSVPWNVLSDCTRAPKKFQIEKKDPGHSLSQRAEVNLEIFESSTHEVLNIVLTLRDMIGGVKKSG